MNARKIMKDFSMGKPLRCIDCAGIAKALWQGKSGPEPTCLECANLRRSAQQSQITIQASE